MDCICHRSPRLGVQDFVRIPKADETQKEVITNLAKRVLLIRASHKPMCLGELYNPKTMPEDLRIAHENLDKAVELAYRIVPFDSDDERLSFLLELYAIATKGKK